MFGTPRSRDSRRVYPGPANRPVRTPDPRAVATVAAVKRSRAVVTLAAVAVLTASCTGSRPSRGASPPPSTPGATTPLPGGTPGSGRRPNVLVLLADDQAFRLFARQMMPQVFSQVVDRGAWFTRNYVNSSECCPSRASIRTGLYAHDTGVDSNFRPLDGTTPARPTFVRALQEAG